MNYNFDSIAGYEQEKKELRRLCDIFNNRAKYEQKGAKLPKGIIFYGGAGTGKTLFAKVMASVCNLEVFKIDLGGVENESAICQTIKKTFARASKRRCPTMIFFDEMDKVLPNDAEEYYTDRSKTILTQLLTLIDGMDSADNIVFVATCNYYNTLPQTIIRPGRIDKKIGIGNPDYASRVEILKLYAEKSSCQFEQTMEEIAKLTNGFSCAALETLVNECVLQSDENGFVSKQLVCDRFFEIKNEDIPRPKSNVEMTVRACRNIGAFVVAKTLNDGNYVLNLERDTVCNNFFNEVVADYDGDFGGDDWEDDDEEKDEYADDYSDKYFHKSDLTNTITVLLGGYAAQELVLHKTYDNLGFWLSIAEDILLEMARSGMFGLSLRYDDTRDRELRYSPERVEKLNLVFDETIEACYQKAKATVSKNENLIKRLIPILIEKEMLDKKQCEPILAELGGIQK